VFIFVFSLRFLSSIIMYLHMSQMHSFSVFLGKESICLNRATVHCLNVLIGFIGDISMCNTLFFTITFIRFLLVAPVWFY
jgi:hypothetical protein